MSLQSSVGLAYGTDSYAVGTDACQEAVTKLGGEPDLVIVFASVSYEQDKVLAGVRSVSKQALVVGSSTAGEITTDGPSKKHSVAVMALRSSSVKFYAGVGENIAANPRAAGKASADAVKNQSKETLAAFMMYWSVMVPMSCGVFLTVWANIFRSLAALQETIFSLRKPIST